ncbi:poly [ADP-ribose] polymerase tankyrase-1-like [Schistocerca piceifrons]|uniref:poly [ADP-ribose] polymerase tankyrase-1-like n=1 Tax=Schistocerca piceifrons TaxID=274613 RepID=UPI001F5EDB14|nr:poly [ADP-ribose] polymerase tankyrase-1-like [Schistocerca piceifrons]
MSAAESGASAQASVDDDLAPALPHGVGEGCKAPFTPPGPCVRALPRSAAAPGRRTAAVSTSGGRRVDHSWAQQAAGDSMDSCDGEAARGPHPGPWGRRWPVAATDSGGGGGGGERDCIADPPRLASGGELRHACGALVRGHAHSATQAPGWTLPADMNSRGLLQSATRGSMEEVQVLLGAGADVGYRGWTMWTALHYAAKQGHTDIVRCLIGNGAEVDARTDVRQTPLHLAAWKGHAAVVRLLAASSADVDAKDQWGRTPLHWAAPYGNAEAAKALLEAGADRDAKEDAGNTALDLARVNKRQWMVEILSSIPTNDCDVN